MKFCTRVKQEIDIINLRGATQYMYKIKWYVYLHLVGQLTNFPHAKHTDVYVSTLVLS